MVDESITIDSEFMNQVVQGVFQTMLDIELTPVEPAINDACLLATIQITGAWSGSLSLALSPDLARNAASRMLNLSVAEVTSLDEQEVAAELANMVGGNLKSLLPGPSLLSLPAVQAVSTVAETRTATVDRSLVSSEGSLRVRVHRRLVEIPGAAQVHKP